MGSPDVLATKEVAALLMRQMKKWSYDLIRAAALMSVPVAGVVKAIDSVWETIQDYRETYRKINMIYDLVSSFVQAKTQIVDNLFRMTDLYEGIVRTANARVR
jgi:hypothetical protein